MRDLSIEFCHFLFQQDNLALLDEDFSSEVRSLLFEYRVCCCDAWTQAEQRARESPSSLRLPESPLHERHHKSV